MTKLKHWIGGLFGTANSRMIRKIEPLVEEINALEADIATWTDAQIVGQTELFRARLAQGEAMDDLLVEAFATVREAAKRTLGQRHYDVQLLGGIVLHRGMIAEMKTGEGKTLVSTLAAYLHALSEKGVHVVTVNDYLAKRDCAWMGQVFTFLGMRAGCIYSNMPEEERREAYLCDITYGTNNEFGFDYLRDNMKFSKKDMVQRPFHYAIVDEVDSILIDEARTPLIISGPAEDRTDLYVALDRYIPRLNPEHYEKDEKARSVSLTEEGISFLEDCLRQDKQLPPEGNLYDLEHMAHVHHINQALKAHVLFEKDKDYIVKDGKIIIIDEFTGRMMEGRRYSEGLHQALEAKEGVPIQNENQTLASITFQNYFRLYPTLSGMTGTALTEADEFADIYSLEVVEVPTNRPISRRDDDDAIYRTAEEKYEAIVEEIKKRVANKQPVLVGTASIERSEYLSRMLKKSKIAHHVLNARYHAQEATIIAQAGCPSAVTIATNMAGRGTDIQLGGNVEMMIAAKVQDVTDAKKRKKVEGDITKQVERDKAIALEAGGLCVIGTERHESRRIDNQLRGRSGRQGDPGYSKFFLSAEDDLIRIFGADKKMDWVLGTMGEPGEPISHPLITRMMEKSQKKVEERNYEMRKTLLKFDDVMNDQRKVIFEQRREIMESEDVSQNFLDMVEEIAEEVVLAHIPEKSYPEQWDTEGLEKEIFRLLGLQMPVVKWAQEEGVAEQDIIQQVQQKIEEHIQAKTETYGENVMKELKQHLLLMTLDELWKDHLHALDYLRQGIGLRAYGQKDPLNEYKREAFAMFATMMAHLREMVVSRLCRLELREGPQDIPLPTLANVQEGRVDPALARMPADQKDAPPSQAPVATRKKAGQRDPADPSTWGRVGRNELCPCGSGKKYKQCHGKLAS